MAMHLSPETPEERRQKARIGPADIARAKGFVRALKAPEQYRIGKAIKTLKAGVYKRFWDWYSSENGQGTRG